MTNLAMLECTLVVLLMSSAVAFVVTFDTPSGGEHVIYHDLEAKATNFLTVSADFPDNGACNGRTRLETLITEGVQGRGMPWQRRVSSYFSTGIAAELYLDNGHFLYPIHAADGFKGITAEIDLQPDFSFLSSIRDLTTVEGQTPLGANLVGFHHGELVRVAGDAVRVRLRTHAGLGTSEYVAWGKTALIEQISGGESQVARNVTWTDLSGSPTLHHSLLPADLAPQGMGTEFLLHLEPAVESARLQQGLTLSIHAPPSWKFVSADAKGWHLLNSEDERLHFVATLEWPAEGITLRFKPPSNPIHPFDVLHARLGNGSLGESSLVVTYPTSAERSLPRTIHPTVPYPLQPGARALFGLAFANGGEKTVVTQVDIEIPGGYDVWRNDGEGAELFAEADVLRPSDQDGSWERVDARHLRWTGERVVEALGASSWTLGVRVTDDPGEATSVEPTRSGGPEGQLRFPNGFEHRSARWGPVPGVVRHEVPPASGPGAADGYPWTPAVGEAGAAAPREGDEGGNGGGSGSSGGSAPLGGFSHEAELRTVAAAVEGRASYAVSPASGDLLRLRSALANSSFAVRERMVPVGGVLQSDADFESLVNELGRAGVADTALTMDLYAPPSRGCAPTATWTRESRSLPLARVRDVLLWDAEGLGAADLFLVAEDGQAYRVNRAGSPLWSVPLPAKGVRLLGAEFGPADRRLYAATEEGAVHRLDPRTGALLWSARVAGGPGTLDGVTALAAQPGQGPQGRVLVGTRLGALVALDAATGAAERSVVVAQGRPILQVEPAPGGDGAGGALAAHGGGVVALGPGLDPDGPDAARWHREGVLGFAAAPGRLLVATAAGRTHDLALPGLSEAEGRGVAHAAPAVLASAGDATGDGVPDLVVALKDRGLAAVSGATGRVAWERAQEPWVDPVPREVPFGALDPWRAVGKRHVCEKASATYQTAHEACEWDARRDQSEPLLLRVGRARTYHAHVGHGTPYLEAVDHHGRLVAQALLEQPPDALAAGPWTLDEAVAVAGTDGALVVHEGEGARWGEPVLRARPTDFVGRFTFFTPVPGGGFFGTHLLVATLSWTEQGATREARLFDWFEVVGPDGRPVLEPSYRVVLVAQDRGHPTER